MTEKIGIATNATALTAMAMPATSRSNDFATAREISTKI
jgi:hypothetical protein